MGSPFRWVVLSLLACAAPAQDRTQPPATPAVASQRFARQLELPERRREAAAALLQLGAASVPALLDEAKHPELGVAYTAFEVLAALEHEGLAAVPTLRERAKGNDVHAKAAAWALARLPHRGTFLVPSMEEGVVREFDAEGKEIWKSPKLGQVWSACILANGNLLAAEIDGGAREYDDKGAVVWEHRMQGVYSAERLIDGNTLLCSYQEQRVLEVDAKGDEVWSQPKTAALHALRLPGGTTLITDCNRGRVFEVARDGRDLWQLEGLRTAYVSHRRRDGTTLVVQQHPGRATLFGKDGKPVAAELALAKEPADVVMLPDGWIECGRLYVRRCDARGKQLWEATTSGWCGRITLR